MKNLLRIVILFFVFNETALAQEVERCPLASEIYYYDTGFSIAPIPGRIGHRAQFVKGKNIGFKYSKFFDCPDMYDEEYGESLGWIVKDNAISFSYQYQNDTLPANLGYTMYNGGWGDRLELVSITGSLKGEQSGNSWIITADLSLKLKSIRPDSKIIIRQLKFTNTISPVDKSRKARKKNPQPMLI